MIPTIVLGLAPLVILLLVASYANEEQDPWEIEEYVERTSRKRDDE